jgi:hypothetical protein
LGVSIFNYHQLLFAMKTLPYFLSLLLLLTTTFTHSAQAQSRVSPQAKGAIIGGLGGAAAGALINKRNRAVGGVVGGVVGGAGGYAVGKSIDNKNKARAAEADAANARAAAARANERAAVAERNAARSRATALAASRTSTTRTVMVNETPGVMAYAASQTTVPNSAYIPNDAPADPAKPYSNSEIKRKSW